MNHAPGTVVLVHTFYSPQPKKGGPNNRHNQPKLRLRSKRFAFLRSGEYQIRGAVSNFWSWSFFKKDGTLENKIYRGYDNGHPYLLESTGLKVEIRLPPQQMTMPI